MVYDLLFAKDKNLVVLIDPDKITNDIITALSDSKLNSKLNAIFIGGSLVMSDTGEIAKQIKDATGLPLILFPGNLSQINKHVDALLFLSLISGRNPEFLIGQHVTAAPIIKNLNLETIPTGYMLFDCGSINSVRYMSATMPLPNNKPDLAIATAIAGEMLGLKALYLEAGSGASTPVSLEIIKAIRSNVSIPIIVGGGIKTKEQMEQIYDAGANLIVIGTAFENTNQIP
ncbi:MAG: geranylgeranylglyceryl/heptaprenylglyceryl phosphate synthase [Salinivirgaceae bacterium]|nr:geranylgeranylglyceryl/heptaprenylglyceryl phosphate synthase [Salinivirgaceae bacterium]MDD4748200.1 geranylgeranylglyceryl/heptaprenylglyceryl phosphate synthase [Salinivirgaceae bacterium]MDY0280643.1 geranylgeranylglyceryl/heptaprenylglyceryl phosphate synthase [Salinivirgaceae bacterium]